MTSGFLYGAKLNPKRSGAGQWFVAVGEFYDLDQRRERSRELDFGMLWQGESGPSWRLSWVRETGELVLVAQTSRNELEQGPAVCLAVIPTEQQVESELAGWAEACNGSGSLRWLDERFLLFDAERAQERANSRSS